MESRKYRPRSSAEERAVAVALYESSGRSARLVADELGMPAKTLEKWIRLSKRRALDPDGSMPEEQLLQLLRFKRENLLLRREVDFLKKADAFFREQDQRGTRSR